jgi:hypothetical protein
LHNFENPRDITQKHKIARQIADSFDLLKMALQTLANSRQSWSLGYARLIHSMSRFADRPELTFADLPVHHVDPGFVNV